MTTADSAKQLNAIANMTADGSVWNESNVLIDDNILCEKQHSRIGNHYYYY